MGVAREPFLGYSTDPPFPFFALAPCTIIMYNKSALLAAGEVSSCISQSSSSSRRPGMCSDARRRFFKSIQYIVPARK